MEEVGWISTFKEGYIATVSHCERKRNLSCGKKQKKSGGRRSKKVDDVIVLAVMKLQMNYLNRKILF